MHGFQRRVMKPSLLRMGRWVFAYVFTYYIFNAFIYTDTGRMDGDAIRYNHLDQLRTVWLR